MFISNVFIDRKDAPEERKYKKFGCIWYDPQRKNASIKFTGFPCGGGTFAGRPFPSVIESGIDLPYIAGDIKMRVGAYEKDGVTKNEYQWIGHIQSQQDGEGNTIYVGAIEVMPVFIAQERGGVFCSIFSDDYKPEEQEPVAQEQTEDSHDDMPF